MQLPEPQHKLADYTAGQPLTPTQIVPAAEQQLVHAPPAGMRVVGWRRIEGTELLEAVYGPQYAPPAPLPPPPPVIDPQAQRTAARGVFAAGTGVGSYFAMQGLAIALQSVVQFLIAAAMCGAVYLASGRRGVPVQGGPTYITNNRGFLAGWKSRTGPRK